MGQMWKTVLQPMIKVGPTTAEQEVRFALPSMGAKNVLAWANVTQNSSTTNPSLKIFGATSLDLPADLATNPFWLSQQTITITQSATGSFTGTLSTPPPYLRWQMSNMTTGTVTFEIVLIGFDT
jgi:hypothetical protein